jgi:hypothetical protein
MTTKYKQRVGQVARRTATIEPESAQMPATFAEPMLFTPSRDTGTRLQNINSPHARQTVFRSLQTAYGNRYAAGIARRYEENKSAVVQRSGLLTAQEEQQALDAMKAEASGKNIVGNDALNKLTNTGYFAIRPTVKISDPKSKEAKEWLYIRDELAPQAAKVTPMSENDADAIIKYLKENYPTLYQFASLLGTPFEIIGMVAEKLGLSVKDMLKFADEVKKPSAGGGETPKSDDIKLEDPADWRAYLPRVKAGGKVLPPFLPKPEPLPAEKGKKKKKPKKQPIVITDQMREMCEQVAQNRQNYVQNFFVHKKENADDSRREYKHARPKDKDKAKYKNWYGYSYLSPADSNSRKAEKSIQTKAKAVKETDGTLETARLAMWAELASEGDANSMNTFDGQGITWGKGNAAGGLLGHVLVEYFKLVPGARGEFNAMGIDADPDSGWLWVVDTETCMQYGGSSSANRALDRINDKHPEIMANLAGFFVQQGEDNSEQVVQAQVNAITKSIPKWAYDLPIHALQFVGHAAHWYSGALGWSRWDDAGSDMGDLLKRFAYLLSANGKTDHHVTKSGSAIIISSGQAVTFALGKKKTSNGYKTWKTETEAVLGEATETKPDSGYHIKTKAGYRRIG